MLTLSGSLRVFLALEPCDMRKSFDGLHAEVVNRLGDDPRSGAVFVFINRSRNLLKLLLRRFEKATLGVLLGLLLGAVVGLWPFQQGVQPAVGDRVKGREVTVERLAEMDPEDYPVVFFRPAGRQAALALGLIVLGFLVTAGVARIGGEGNAA